MKHKDTLLGDPPDREVVRVIDLVGPRGGTTYVLVLSCGHWKTCGKLPSKTAVKCVGCLVEAAMRTRRVLAEDITEKQLVQLFHSARGPSRVAVLTRALVPVALGLDRSADAAEQTRARKRCARWWNARFAHGA